MPGAMPPRPPPLQARLVLIALGSLTIFAWQTCRQHFIIQTSFGSEAGIVGRTNFGELIGCLLKMQNWNVFSGREKNREVINAEMILKLQYSVHMGSEFLYTLCTHFSQ